MKKGLLGSTALIGATAIMAGAASAAEAPTYKISGFLNFQWYITDQDYATPGGAKNFGNTTSVNFGGFSFVGANPSQDLKGMYFGTDDGEIHFNVSGTADNGLTYGFKIELNALQDDGFAADEARISLGGGWGTVLLGDEDGAEDLMNYGGETIMGATGGFDGDQDDWYLNPTFARSFPTIQGDTSDATKATYFSPRFSGFQVGASWTPNATQGDISPVVSTTLYQDWIGLGANYDNTFGDWRVRASAVWAGASFDSNPAGTNLEDISAYSLGAILGFRGFSWGINWTDNGESGGPVGTSVESSYWNTALAWEAGPHYLSLGYFVSTTDGGTLFTGEDELTIMSATYDYSVAPGLGVYLEYTAIEGDNAASSVITGLPIGNDGSVFLLGTQVSF